MLRPAKAASSKLIHGSPRHHQAEVKEAIVIKDMWQLPGAKPAGGGRSREAPVLIVERVGHIKSARQTMNVA